jgi:hypothetical protein
MIEQHSFLIKKISISISIIIASIVLSICIYFYILSIEKNRFIQISQLNNEIELIDKQRDEINAIKKSKAEISDNFLVSKYGMILSGFKVDYVNYVLDKLDEKLKTSVETNIQELDVNQYKEIISSSKSHISKITLSFKYPADLMLIQISKYLFDTLPGSFILNNMTIKSGDNNMLELSLDGLWVYVGS